MGEQARVYATPMLVRDIEIACRELLLQHLDAGEDSVGTRVELERGFIRAEVYTLEDLEHYKAEKEIRAAGKLRLVGRDYIMQDGDICHFLFNV